MGLEFFLELLKKNIVVMKIDLRIENDLKVRRKREKGFFLSVYIWVMVIEIKYF